MQHEPPDNAVLTYATPRPPHPAWVKVGLWGLSSRASAWLFAWLCVATAVISGLLGFVLTYWLLPLAALFGVAAFHYWASIRWVDRHGGWSQNRA